MNYTPETKNKKLKTAISAAVFFVIMIFTGLFGSPEVLAVYDTDTAFIGTDSSYIIIYDLENNSVIDQINFQHMINEITDIDHITTHDNKLIFLERSNVGIYDLETETFEHLTDINTYSSQQKSLFVYNNYLYFNAATYFWRVNLDDYSDYDQYNIGQTQLSAKLFNDLIYIGFFDGNIGIYDTELNEIEKQKIFDFNVYFGIDEDLILTGSGSSLSAGQRLYWHDTETLNHVETTDDTGNNTQIIPFGDYFYTGNYIDDNYYRLAKWNKETKEPTYVKEYPNRFSNFKNYKDKYLLFFTSYSGQPAFNDFIIFDTETDTEAHSQQSTQELQSLHVVEEKFEPDYPEPFDGFEAENTAPDPFSIDEVELKAEINNFGNYNWPESQNHLSAGVQVFDDTGQLIYNPPMSILDDFTEPKELTRIFETEPGKSYSYRWRFHYIDFYSGSTINESTTNITNFESPKEEGDPDIETLAAVDISDTSAELRGQVYNLGLNESLDISFQYREAGAGTWQQTPVVATLDYFEYDFPAVVWEIITGLDPETNYEYRIMANGLAGNLRSFKTTAEPLPDPDPDPDPENSWEAYYQEHKDDEFTEPTTSIDLVGSTLGNFMVSIRQRIDIFRDRLDNQAAYTYGQQAGEFIQTARGYLREMRPFFGGIPLGEIFVFFLIFEFVLLGYKLVILVLKAIPFF